MESLFWGSCIFLTVVFGVSGFLAHFVRPRKMKVCPNCKDKSLSYLRTVRFYHVPPGSTHKKEVADKVGRCHCGNCGQRYINFLRTEGIWREVPYGHKFFVDYL